jgi:glycosyltransferase involved in cell wall biosynthesis
VQNSGIYGYFKENEQGISVNHKDIKDIANKLEFLIADPNKRISIGRNGQRLVQSFTWEKIAEILHERYVNISATNKEEKLL